MEFALRRTSEADKKFVAKNIDWIISILPEEEN